MAKDEQKIIPPAQIKTMRKDIKNARNGRSAPKTAEVLTPTAKIPYNTEQKPDTLKNNPVKAMQVKEKLGATTNTKPVEIKITEPSQTPPKTDVSPKEIPPDEKTANFAAIETRQKRRFMDDVEQWTSLY